MSSRGFTLIEMLVVMTIGAILIAAAVPSFRTLIANTRASNGTNALSGSFEYARSEAIRRGVIVSVCRSLDPNAAPAALACSNAAGGAFAAGDWASGWVMFAKYGAGANDLYEDGVDVLLQVQQPATIGNPRLIVQSNVGTSAVAYNRFGTAALAPTPTFSIDYRDPGTGVLSNAARCIGVLPVMGRVRTYRPAGVC
jgi:type IV fimbrial biogenesis protein FimT